MLIKNKKGNLNNRILNSLSVMRQTKGAVAAEGVFAFSIFFLIIFSTLEMFMLLYVSSVGQFIVYNVAFSASVGGYCQITGVAMGPDGTCSGGVTDLSGNKRTRAALIPVVQDQLKRYCLGRYAGLAGTTDGVQILINGSNTADYINNDTVEFSLVFPKLNLIGFLDTAITVNTMARIER